MTDVDAARSTYQGITLKDAWIVSVWVNQTNAAVLPYTEER